MMHIKKYHGLLIFLLWLVVLPFACVKDKPDIYGCTDPESLNYDEKAVFDAGNCIIAEWKQRALVIEQTATWCSACPSAALYMQGVAAEYNGDVILIAVHGENDDPMEPECFASFRSDRYSNAYPAFFIPDERVYLSPDDVYDTINHLLARKPVIASANMIFNVKKDHIEVTSRTKFFVPSDAAFYQSLFVMENNIDGGDSAGAYKQVNGGLNYKHQHVLRTSADGPLFFGTRINGEPVSAGMLFDRNYKIEIDPQWNMNEVYFVIVIWKYNPTGIPVKYLFVNVTEIH